MTALTPPFLVAALVLIVAGVAKLRNPRGAMLAARGLGLPVNSLAIRAFAALECVAGGLALAHPRGSAIALATLYSLFAAISAVMVRRRLSCGCFGDPDVPASNLGALLSAAFAAVSVAAIARQPHGLGWMVHQTPVIVSVTLVGIVGAVYATVVAYTHLPLAWAAWSAR